MNCRELQPDFIIPAGFRAHHEILQKYVFLGIASQNGRPLIPRIDIDFFAQKKTNPDPIITLLFKISFWEPLFFTSGGRQMVNPFPTENLAPGNS